MPDGEIFTESSRPTGASTEEPSTSITEADSLGLPQAENKYLILLDLQHTLLRYSGSKTDIRKDTHIRPFAKELVQFLLEKQDEGLCQLGFRSTKAAWNAVALLEEFLGSATSMDWVADGAQRHRTLQDTTTPGRSVWLVHGDLSRQNPSALHDRSQTPMQILNLETVIYEFEDITDGARFLRASVVFVTCDGTAPGTHVDEASASNLLRVDGWKWQSEDRELERLRIYFLDFFQRSPSDASEYLKAHVFDDRYPSQR